MGCPLGTGTVVACGDQGEKGDFMVHDSFIAWLAACCLVLSSGFTHAGQAYPACAGLEHHWSFDEGPDWHDAPLGVKCDATVAHDLVGGNDARLISMDSSAWVSGRQFTALHFDGKLACLELNTPVSSLARSASVSLWFRTGQTGLDTPNDCPAIMGQFDKDRSGSAWGALDRQGRIGLIVNNQWLARSVMPVNDNRWHHLVMTRNNVDGSACLFLDGVEAISTQKVNPPPRISRSFTVRYIGCVRQPGKTAYFEGDVDQLYVFTRVIDALTLECLKSNHAPKAWPKVTAGTRDHPFDTESIVFHAYDPDQDPVFVSGFKQPAHGKVTELEAGSFRYSPQAGFVGEDSFQVVLADGLTGYYRTSVPVRIDPLLPAATRKRTTRFTHFQPLQGEGQPFGYSGIRVVRVIDWNQDGKPDLLVGYQGAIWLHLNIGTAKKPEFAAGKRLQAGQADIQLGNGMVGLAIADVNGDGRPDLIACGTDRQAKLFKNTAAAGKPFVLAAPVSLLDANGHDLVVPDARLDAGDLDGDGKVDLVTGTHGGPVCLLRNVGDTFFARFAAPQVLFNDAYSVYPRITDLDRNGIADLVWGVNWGSLSCRFNEAARSAGSPTYLQVEDDTGRAVELRKFTDGPIADFADLNGDGILDVIMGGHFGSGVYVAYGCVRSIPDILREIDQIYAENMPHLGVALDRDNQRLLGAVRTAYRSLVDQIVGRPLEERRAAFLALADHVRRHPFLNMAQPLDTREFHHVPAIAGQTLILLHSILPDTPEHRREVADVVGLEGLHREIYLTHGFHVGDNQRGSRGQLESLRDFLAVYPRELFPDDMISLDHYAGDGSAARVYVKNSCKNTFNCAAGDPANEWAPDLTRAIEAAKGKGSAHGDYFTMVYAHEAVHSLDHYIRTRQNADLLRRWGQCLVYAAGPDIVGGSNGWMDWEATKLHFKDKGLWLPPTQSWNDAWKAYWDTPAGKERRHMSFMRGGIDWFLSSPQESLATQANQYFMDSEARLIGAMDRANRGYPENLTEVVTFIDFVSAGLNEMVFYNTDAASTPYPRAVFNTRHAWLTRDNLGHITEIALGDKVYAIQYDPRGLVRKIEVK